MSNAASNNNNNNRKKKLTIAKPNEKTILLISAFDFHIEKLDTIKTILESKYSSAVPSDSLF